MIRQSDHVANSRSRYISPVLVMLSALLMLGVSACSKTQEQDTIGASQAQAQSAEQPQGQEEPQAVSRPDDASQNQGEEIPPQDLYDDAPQAHEAEASAPAAGQVERAPQTPKISSEEQHVAAQKLDGHWLLDTDATLELLPEESRDALREVFEQVRTGVAFTAGGDATMNVVSQGEKNEQEGKYAVSDAKEEAVRIEFLIDDPALAEQDVRIFATLIFEDQDTVHYQASTEEQGRVVQREQIAVMKRVTPEEYNELLR